MQQADLVAAANVAPAIPDLTANLSELPEGDWRDLLGKLRRTGLMAPESEHRPDTLDAHPLVREHFGQQLREDHPDAWRAGNDRLYEHYKQAAPELPDTLDEMAPLFAAVAHGCAAGRHHEALDEVYYRRIRRGGKVYSLRKLGAFGADLAALSGFFDPPWRRPVDTLDENARGFVLNEAGFDLRALGRLADAAEPMRAALGSTIAQDDWQQATAAASNLSELYVTIGDLRQALEIAQQNIDRTDDSVKYTGDIIKRTTMATVLHQIGETERAEALFGEAEAMQKESEPQYPLLYSLRGCNYCDLLLGQGKHREVQDRATRTLEWVEQGGLGLLTLALDHLSLGRAYLAEAQQEGKGQLSKAAQHLDTAVDGLRQAGQQQELPRGFLARAALHRVRGDFDLARRDLDEALSIAERGGMGLHQADGHLEYARLYLAMGEEAQARERLATAKEMIGRMGYHRRDGEVAELEGQLKAG